MRKRVFGGWISSSLLQMLLPWLRFRVDEAFPLQTLDLEHPLAAAPDMYLYRGFC